jgi:hypothetical protein
MIEINHNELIPQFNSILETFFSSDKKELLILGKPYTGKRYHIENYLKKNNITYEIIGNINGTKMGVALSYYEELYKYRSNIVLIENASIPLFKNKLVKENLLNLKSGLPLINPYPKSGIPKEFTFEGKIIIIDDPYTKVKKGFLDEFHGYRYLEFRVQDLVEYTKKYIDSISTENSIDKKYVEKALKPYEFVLKNSKQFKDLKPLDFYFSISGIVQTARDLEKEKNMVFAFPQEIIPVVEFLREKGEL